MDITKKIASYEDACKELGLNPEHLPVVDSLPQKDRNSIIAYHKLVTIIRALNEGWEADFSNHEQIKYWIWLWVDTEGFVYAYTDYSHFTASYAIANFGSRLCFRDQRLAKYAIKRFQSLYEEYLLII